MVKYRRKANRRVRKSDSPSKRRKLHKHKSHCMLTKKVIFRNATQAMWRIKTLENGKHAPQWYYRCEGCGFLHLTSKPKRGIAFDVNGEPYTGA